MSTNKKPHPVDIHVGERLRDQRAYADISQTALAERVGITFQQLQKYESGANRVSASRLWELAQVLAVPIEFFFPAPEQGSLLAWRDDPAFVQWVRLYHTLPEETRQLTISVAKALAKERLS